MGHAFYKLDQYEQAIELYVRAIKLNPKDTDTLFTLGNAYCNIGDFEHAIKSYEQAVNIEENDHEIWNHLGKPMWRLNISKSDSQLP